MLLLLAVLSSGARPTVVATSQGAAADVIFVAPIQGAAEAAAQGDCSCWLPVQLAQATSWLEQLLLQP
jgi:hypothetical protein